MSGAQHTPGPWDLVSLSGYGGPFSIRMEYRSANPDAPKTYYGVHSVRRREDAILIAAAPDMLEALRKAVGRLEDIYDHVALTADQYEPLIRDVDALIAVIAKAEGCS